MAPSVEGNLQGRAPPATGRISVRRTLEGLAVLYPPFDLVEPALTAKLVELLQDLEVTDSINGSGPTGTFLPRCSAKSGPFSVVSVQRPFSSRQTSELPNPLSLIERFRPGYASYHENV